jgi:hypothetical protein
MPPKGEPGVKETGWYKAPLIAQIQGSHDLKARLERAASDSNIWRR